MVIVYFVITFLTLAATIWAAETGSRRNSEGMAVLTGFFFITFVVEVVGVWNLAANSVGCCK